MSKSRTRSRTSSTGSSVNNNSRVLDHDALSIYIGNVDYSAHEEELRDMFIGCGDIVRCTLIRNMRTGQPKGAAFIEFTDKEAIEAALILNGKELKGDLKACLPLVVGFALKFELKDGRCW
jgi:RNA recognition motif-containing protein